MTATGPRPHNWDQLSPEMQAAVNRTVAKVRPGPQGWDPEQCQRLATLLGLRSPSADGGRDADA